MHKVCTGMEKSVFATLLIFYLFLAKWTAVHNLVVLFTLTLSHIIATRVGLCIGQIEGSTSPPRATPRAFDFLKIFVQIPPYPGQNTVQMPHTRVRSGDQMPRPWGHFKGT